MAPSLTVLAAAAVAVAASFALYPEYVWGNLGWAWFTVTKTFGMQALCYLDNPIMVFLFGKAEQAFLASGVRPPPPYIPDLPAEEYSWERLGQVTHGYSHPAVIRGLFKDSVAREKWGDPQYFVDTYPEETIMARELKEFPWHTRCKIDHDMSFPPPTNFAEMQEWVKQADRSWKTWGWSPPAGSSNVTQLERDLPLTRLGTPKRVLPWGLVTIFSRSADGTKPGEMTTDWHSAMLGNMAIHIVGTKTWRVVSPTQGHLMRPVTQQAGRSVRSYVGQNPAVLNKLSWTDVTMKPGDVYFNPPWYWHTVMHAGEPQWTVLTTHRMEMLVRGIAHQKWLSLNAYNVFSDVYKWRFFTWWGSN